MLKAKNHYKDEWAKAMQEISSLKRREEANAKAMLRKQHLELEHLRLRYLAAEENGLIKAADENQHLESLKSQFCRQKMNKKEQQPASTVMASSANGGGGENILRNISSNFENIDTNMRDHLNRLRDERDTLLKTGVYSPTDAIIVELDRRIRECTLK